MHIITIDFEGRRFQLELHSSVIGDKNVYTILVNDPTLIPYTGRVISYLSEVNQIRRNPVVFSSEKSPFNGRLKQVIAEAIEKHLGANGVDE